MSRPDATVEVSILVDGLLHATIPAAAPRPDLAREPERYGDGRHGFSYSFPVPLSSGQEHRVRVIARATGDLLAQGQTLLAAERALPTLCPVLVTAPGRSGTTQMMHRLSQAGDIVAAPHAPFETRMLAYYAAAYRVLTAPGDLEHSTHPDRLEGDGRFFGANPFGSSAYATNFTARDDFNAFFSGAVPETFLRAIRRLIVTYYAMLANGQTKYAARYFAEKNNNLDAHVRHFLRLAFAQVREIVMVRDPRDLMVSQLAYFRGREVEPCFAECTVSCSALLAIQRQQRRDTLFVRYEDMILRPGPTFQAVSAFLGTQIPEHGAAAEEAAVFQGHATSASPAASIGRWKSQLDPALAARCTREWRDLLTLFGYDGDAASV
ncbi:MAG: sulfotransferase [Rhodospirillales bacterium]|nr:sulfotransferase [Rhodospirillales bacterium]